MSDIMFYFKVWVNNRIIVYVFYQQEPTEQTNQKIQAMIIALLTNFASNYKKWLYSILYSSLLMQVGNHWL